MPEKNQSYRRGSGDPRFHIDTSNFSIEYPILLSASSSPPALSLKNQNLENSSRAL